VETYRVWTPPLRLIRPDGVLPSVLHASGQAQERRGVRTLSAAKRWASRTQTNPPLSLGTLFASCYLAALWPLLSRTALSPSTPLRPRRPVRLRPLGALRHRPAIAGYQSLRSPRRTVPASAHRRLRRRCRQCHRRRLCLPLRLLRLRLRRYPPWLHSLQERRRRTLQRPWHLSGRRLRR